MPEGNGLAGLPANGDSEAPDEILAEIHDRLARGRPRDRRRGDELDSPDRRSGRRHERAEVAIEHPHPGPGPVVEAGREPAGPFSASIVRLAVVQVAGQDRPGAGPPGRVGDDPVGGPVRVLDLELGEQPQPIAVDVAPPAAETRAGPDTSRRRASLRGRSSLAAQMRHVEGLVAQAVVVAGPAGCQDVIADAYAVDLSFVQPERCDVQPSARDFTGRQERVPEERRWLID